MLRHIGSSLRFHLRGPDDTGRAGTRSSPHQRSETVILEADSTGVSRVRSSTRTPRSAPLRRAREKRARRSANRIGRSGDVKPEAFSRDRSTGVDDGGACRRPLPCVPLPGTVSGVVSVLAGFRRRHPVRARDRRSAVPGRLLGVVPWRAMAQLVMRGCSIDEPTANLRGDHFIAALSEPRGLYLAALGLLVASGALVGPLAFLALACSLRSRCAQLGCRFQPSYRGTRPSAEQERDWWSRHDGRLAGDRRSAAVADGIALDGLAQHIGLMAYALPFLVSECSAWPRCSSSTAAIRAGRVPPAALGKETESNEAPDFRRFLMSARSTRWAWFRAIHVRFMISILGLSQASHDRRRHRHADDGRRCHRGGSRLARGSSERLLRTRLDPRPAMFLPLLAWPGL